MEINRKILVIDDNEEIHKDFRKVLIAETGVDELHDLAKEILGETSSKTEETGFVIDSALQGEEGLAKVKKALRDAKPYALAFVDIRMPPGWDGIETIRRLWEADAEIQTVIITAYADYRWEQISEEIGRTDRLIILKKPFDSIEVRQLAGTLTHKWTLSREKTLAVNSLKEYQADLESLIEKRTAELNEEMEKVKILSGMLPICSHCKKVRDDEGYWNQIEAYIHDHSEAEISHCICPVCAQEHYPEYMEKILRKLKKKNQDDPEK